MWICNCKSNVSSVLCVSVVSHMFFMFHLIIWAEVQLGVNRSGGRHRSIDEMRKLKEKTAFSITELHAKFKQNDERDFVNQEQKYCLPLFVYTCSPCVDIINLHYPSGDLNLPIVKTCALSPYSFVIFSVMHATFICSHVNVELPPSLVGNL